MAPGWTPHSAAVNARHPAPNYELWTARTAWRAVVRVADRPTVEEEPVMPTDYDEPKLTEDHMDHVDKDVEDQPTRPSSMSNQRP